jgi:hypothetical protein
MRTLLTFVSLASLASLATAQSVVAPFTGAMQVVNLGFPTNVFNYGGTAFVPGNPNVILFGAYGSAQIMASVVSRDGFGRIDGVGAATPVASVGGPDGGLAFGPGNVLFATWWPDNKISQFKPGSVVPDRVDDLSALGVSVSVGSCTFVPTGQPGAGRLKVVTWPSSEVYDVPLTPDGNGTYALGPIGAPVQIANGPEGLVYASAALPLIAGQLLVAEWNTGDIVAYQVDAIGNPIPGTQQTVVGGAVNPGGGAIDPLTGDAVFLSGNGVLILRPGVACGGFANYGNASPGGLGTPTIGGSGCANVGQTFDLVFTGPQNGAGVVALGYFPTSFFYFNVEVLQSLDASVGLSLDPTGQGLLSLTLPNIPSLGWAHVYWQAAFLDPSTPSGLIATDGLDTTFR